MTNANDQVFPTPFQQLDIGDYHDTIPASSGITKREYFAGMALIGALANSHPDVVHEDAYRIAVEHADALINELNKTESK